MRKTKQELSDIYGKELIFADGFDDAIIGVAAGFDSARVVYCYASMVEVMMNDKNMNYEDALDWIEYNTLGSYVGKNTPIYVMGIDNE
tara:strand:- start:2312 stop:2575 length:264 start_codon:yes stop_codon:yes gene_type:complete